MTNPYQSFDSESYAGYSGEYQSPKGVIPSGMVQQVRVLSILNAVQGGLEIIMGIFWGVYAVVLPMMMNNPEFREQMEGQPDQPPPEVMEWMAIGFGVFAFVLVALGVLRIVAGVRNWGFRGRALGIASITIGSLSALGCYCGLTGIALLIYGLIVYLNPSVIQAFEMGKQDLPGDRILYEFSPYRQSGS